MTAPRPDWNKMAAELWRDITWKVWIKTADEPDTPQVIEDMFAAADELEARS